MGGYDAGYYGYLWAKVYGDDMFSRFEDEGILSPAVGADYRREILEPGGSADAEDLAADSSAASHRTRRSCASSAWAEPGRLRSGRLALATPEDIPGETEPYDHDHERQRVVSHPTDSPESMFESAPTTTIMKAA